MKNKEIFEKMSDYGYNLLMIDENDTVELLNSIANSDEHRILEGFPVVLLNIIRRGGMAVNDYKRLNENAIKMVKLSLALYLLEGNKSIVKGTVDKFKLNKNDINGYLKKLESRNTLNVKEMKLDSTRMINTFEKYRNETQSRESNKIIELRKNMEFNISMNILFSPKQKELVFKRLNGEVFSQTEKEYYSRIVKKKIEAILNESVRELLMNL